MAFAYPSAFNKVNVAEKLSFAAALTTTALMFPVGPAASLYAPSGIVPEPRPRTKKEELLVPSHSSETNPLMLD